MGTSGIHIADPQDGTPADVIATAPVSDTGQAGLAVRVISQLGGSSGGAAVTVADGADVTQGAVADAAWSGAGSGTVVAILKAIWTRLRGGQATMTNSLPVVLASDQASVPVAATLSAETVKVIGTVNVASAQSIAATQSGTWTVQPGNSANTTAWKVDGSAVTQPSKELRAATSTRTDVASSSSTVTVLALNANRLGATIYNDSTQNVYLKFGTTATASDFTIMLYAAQYFELPFGYTGRVDGIWVSANGNARVTELTA